MTYKDMLLRDLEQGQYISVFDGFFNYGSTNIRTEVLKLRREGYNIKNLPCRNKVSKKRFVKYYLVADGVRREY